MAKRPKIGEFGSLLSATEAVPHDAPKGQGRALPSPAAPAPAATEALMAAPRAPELRQKRRSSAPTEAKAVFIRVTPESLEAIQDLAGELGTFVQDIGVLALNDLLEKYGKGRVVQGPSSRR